MIDSRTRTAVIGLVTLGLSLLSMGAPRAGADVPTPTPAATVAIPPTALATVLPTSSPTVISYPTVVQERSSPVPTTVTTATSTPTTVPTVTPQPEIPTAAVPTATPTPVPPGPSLGVTPSPSSGASWPTPAQLEQNARLRWGGRVPPSVRRWAFLIVPAGKRYHVDPNLIAAVMTMESNGDPLALSPADARGLMQILHGPWDPKTNVDLGTRMLAGLYAQFGDWQLALAGYNAGPGAVTSYGGIPPYRETRDYVIIVQYLWDLYDHHHLTSHRRVQYGNSLRDLRHFASQRKKVARLARIAHLPSIPTDVCAARACGPVHTASVSAAPDPFWPSPDAPDPLQRVEIVTAPSPTVTGSTSLNPAGER